jgi:aminocarboxymuconate-semialdehyde decarboxylase
MDKNGKKANLPELPSTYIKRMYTDTVSPHALGMEFAVRFFGPDHVMYGSDYPCWMPADALRFFGEVGFAPDVQAKILGGNARRILNLDTPALVPA